MLWGTVQAASPSLTCSSPLACFVQPGVPCEIIFAADGVPDGTELRYLVRDFAGAETGEGRGTVSGGSLTVRMTFPAGFHELDFPLTGQRIGIASLAEHCGGFDDFWGINTILSVKAVSGGQTALFSDFSLQEEYLKVLARSGIGQIREMAGFFLRAPEEAKIDFGAGHWSELRGAAGRYGIRVLTFYEHFSDWTGTERPRQVQVTRLDRFAGPLLEMLRQEEPSASGVQVFNEGDIERKCAPPDGTAALTWLVRRLLDENRLSTPLIGMAFCYPQPPPRLLNVYAENGFFDAVDAISFNYYDTPDKLASDFACNMENIAGISRRIPPVWITESGRAWPQGSRRPAAEADRASANWIVRKAVESKAIGVDRYYAFCLPFFDEGKNNFGMFDCDSTPLRGFVAYAAAVGRLSGMAYLGDLSRLPAGCRSARVFSDGTKAVVVFAADGGGIPLKDFPASAFFGIDGSAAALRADGTILLSGGVLYAELPHASAARLATADTDAMRTRQLLRQRKSPVAKAFPVVLRHHFEELPRHAAGYSPMGGSFPLKVTAFNFSGQPVALDLKLEVDGRESAPGFSLSVPANGTIEFSRAVSGGRELRITDRNNNCPPLFLYCADRKEESKP